MIRSMFHESNPAAATAAAASATLGRAVAAAEAREHVGDGGLDPERDPGHAGRPVGGQPVRR